MNNIQQLQTPCFILEEAILEANLTALRNEFLQHWPNLIVGYSYKTNALPWLIGRMKQRGLWAEVVSAPEYQLASKIGCPKSEIILNGPNKGYETLREALNAGAIVNVDHFQEVAWIARNFPKDRKWKVGLRLNLNLEKQFPGETVSGREPGRFGFNTENGDVERAIQCLNNVPNVSVNGLHVHHSTRTKSLAIFSFLAENLVKYAQKIPNPLDYVDIGGGFYGDKPSAPTYQEYAAAISDPLKQYFSPESTALVVEPGAALAASCFSYLCSVIDTRKIDGHTLVTTDGSIMQIDPQMQGRNFPLEVIEKGITAPSDEENPPSTLYPPPSTLYPLPSTLHPQIICGYTCMERDRFARINYRRTLKPGDQLHFHLTGAYTLAFAPLFIEYFPTVYLKDAQGHYSTIRKKWGVEEYLQGYEQQLTSTPVTSTPVTNNQ